MKKLRMRSFLFLGVLMMVLFAACSKDEDVYDPAPQLRADVDTIKAYLKKNNLTATLDSSSGIFYNIAAPGNGVDSVKYTSTKVKTLYTGKFLSDIVFDSSGTTPAEFYAGNVIPGFQFGITRITKGGKIRVYIPSQWAYGRQGSGKVPPNTPLIFDIELVDINNQ